MHGKRSEFKRSGLHRLECSGCGAYVYGTVANLERHGMPVCGCGGGFMPERLELAMLLGLEDAPVVVEYERELSSVIHGQASHVQRGRSVRVPEAVAAERVERDRRERGRAHVLAALRPVAEPIPF